MVELIVAIARTKHLVGTNREFDDEEALFCVGDVRALLDALTPDDHAVESMADG